MTATYRIKGLHNLIEPVQARKDVTKSASPVANTDSAAMLDQVDKALGNPNLTDVLYHFDDFHKLTRLWPTFEYLHPSRTYGASKTAPLHLADYLHAAEFDEPDLFADSILELSIQQSRDQIAIRDILARQFNGLEMLIGDSPLASSVASYLMRGSQWLADRREQLLTIILKSSAAAFVALASGAWSKNTSILLDRISASPDLTLELWRSHGLRQLISEEWILRALGPYPVHCAVVLASKRENLEAGVKLLHRVAKRDSFGAGVCLGLDPFNDLADKWWDLAQKNNHSLYWAGRVWKAGGASMLEFPRSDEILARLSASPSWCYHWARDVDSHAAKRHARHLWPSAWAVELIVDLSLPKDFVVELVNQSDFNEFKPWDSSIILWAAEYNIL